MNFKRLAILATHPIQYQAPWFRALAAHPEVELQVFFCQDASAREQSQAGFGVEFEWDVPLLEGYPHRFLKNVAKQPSIATFRGLDTPEIAGILAREKFDALLVSGWNHLSDWQAFRGAKKTRTPLMVRGDSHLHTQRSRLKRALKDIAYRQFIPRFDACLAVGQWSRDYYKYYGAPESRIFLVPHAVNAQWFEAEAKRLRPRRAELRREWGLGEEAIVFVFVGKFIDVKRPLDFVRAIAQARRKNPAVEGLMVGDGPLRAMCEEGARNLGASVRFAGFLNQSEIVRAYAASDALVLPSLSETWSLVVNEAMTCGLACAVSDQVGCGPDLIVPDQGVPGSGSTGAVFPVGDVEALGQVLVALARDPLVLAEMGRRAQSRVQERYSMQAAVRGVLQAMEAVEAAAGAAARSP